MRDDTKKNTEEAVVETTDMPTKTDELQTKTDELQNAVVETPVEQVESLFDWVDSVTAEYKIRFDVWVVEGGIADGGESPVLCIKAIRGDKVSRPAYINAAYRNRREMRYAIESVIKEVLPT